MFALSIAENISCSSETCFANIKQRLFDVNIDYLLTKYPKGINTELDKAYEDEGIDLSGGEKQKLAIARALNKGGDIFILDEPTSSLDPKAEAEIFEQFEHLVENKMTFYVSHRMSSSRLCDKILVIDKGRLLQFGNHNELIKQIDGLYYKMFMAQAWNYVDEVKINKKT